ncbi:MAG: flagellar M-ring protein FliF [Alphaproteobacteria bacterium]|nr:flagellar M-ring protein FliF [Alphaproteobacteria bacterium]MDE2341389.1 flagellar M-ring protein FliF [Alphaproteobacteria bacterium]
MPAIGIVLALALAGLAWWAIQPDAQQPLFAGASEADKAAITQALQTGGIAYSLDRDSGNIMVGDENIHRARMLLAAQGLPKGAPTSDSILSSLPMGSSRAVQDQALDNAREADIARSIESIDAVKSARVNIAVPEQSAFIRDNGNASASVMLTLRAGQSLSPGQVGAIRHLVASSVPGLTADAVSVVDQSGELLSTQDPGLENANFNLQTQIEDRLRDKVRLLLLPMLGEPNFTTQLHVDVDSSESQSTRETYPKNESVLRSEAGNRSTNSSMSSPASGIPGALSNLPPPPATLSMQSSKSAVAAPTQDGQSDETYNRNYDVGREISVTHQPDGRIKRLTLAVAVRLSRDGKHPNAAELAALTDLVKNAVGFDVTRGDVVVVNARPFSDPDIVVDPFWKQDWFLNVARQVAALIAAIVALFLVGRPALKQWRKQSEERARVNEMIAQSSQQLGLEQPVTLAMLEQAPQYAERAALVREFVKQDIERARHIVRQMLTEATHD